VNLSAQQFGQATVVSIAGSVDALTAGEVTSFLSAQVQEGKRRLVADLSQVDFMSSAGLRVILATLKESRKEGGDLHIAAAQPGVEKILKMSGFTTILNSYPTVAEAVAGFGG
jgi:anti-anti-sigma factor